MITPDKLHALCTDATIVMTQHLTVRCQERDIKYNDIKQTILKGEIIEQYPTDYPYPSCLILHLLESGKHLHVVVGVANSRLWIVTAYYPDNTNWKDDYRKRKAVE